MAMSSKKPTKPNLPFLTRRVEIAQKNIDSWKAANGKRLAELERDMKRAVAESNRAATYFDKLVWEELFRRGYVKRDHSASANLIARVEQESGFSYKKLKQLEKSTDRALFGRALNVIISQQTDEVHQLPEVVSASEKADLLHDKYLKKYQRWRSAYDGLSELENVLNVMQREKTKFERRSSAAKARHVEEKKRALLGGGAKTVRAAEDALAEIVKGTRLVRL